MSDIREKGAELIYKGYFEKRTNAEIADEFIDLVISEAIERVKADTAHMSVCSHYFNAVINTLEGMKK